MLEKICRLLSHLGVAWEATREAIAIRGGVTRIRFEEKRVQVHGLTSTGRLLVETPFDGEHHADRLAELNLLVGLSAFVGGDGPRLCTRFTCHEGFEEEEVACFPLMATIAAVVQGHWLAGVEALAGGRRVKPILDGPPLDDAAIARDLRAARAALARGGERAIASPTEVVAELAWPPGRLTAPAGATTRLTVLAGEAHPLLGAGLRFTLTPPIAYGTEAALASAELNRREAEGTISEPFLGAWHPTGDGRIAFATFLPAVLVGGDTICLVAEWLALRHQTLTAGDLPLRPRAKPRVDDLLAQLLPLSPLAN